ncbi:MAG: hypothetical protein ACLQHA_05925 [Thermoplasmata archaeon]
MAVVIIAVVAVLGAAFALGSFTSKGSSSGTAPPGCSVTGPATLDTYRVLPGSQSLTLSSSSSMYLFEGSTGGHPISSVSWTPDLNVSDLGTPGGPAISIGHGSSASASYSSSAGTYIIAGLGVSNFCSYQTVTGHAASFRSPIDAWANFSTTGSSEVFVVVGGEGVGSLGTPDPMSAVADQTYSPANNEVNASVAIYTALLVGGSYSFEVTSTMNVATNSGSGGSLGIVVYIFPYAGSPKSSTPIGTAFSWGPAMNATSVSGVEGCPLSTGHYCYTIEIATATIGLSVSNIQLSLRGSSGQEIAWPSGGVVVSLVSPTATFPIATYDTATATWTLVPPFSGAIGAGDGLVIYSHATGANQGLLGEELSAIGTNGYSGVVNSLPFS